MRHESEYDFIVTLKHPDYKIYNLISILLCVLTVAAATFALLQSLFFSFMWLNIFLIAVIIFSLMIAFINLNKKETIITFKWALYAAAFLWLLYPLHQPFIGVVFIIAALLERQIKFPNEIGF